MNNELKIRAWVVDWSDRNNDDGWVNKKGKPLKNGMQFVGSIFVSNSKKVHIKMHDWKDYRIVDERIKLMYYIRVKDEKQREIFTDDIIKTNFPGFKFGFVDFYLGEYILRNGSAVCSIRKLLMNKWKLNIAGNMHKHPNRLNKLNNKYN